MPKFRRIKFKNLKNILERLPRKLAERSFLTFLGLLLVALIFGAFIFYQYSILAEAVAEVSEEEIFQFDRSTYQKILDEWTKRNEKFLEINSKTYPNPFLKLTD